MATSKLTDEQIVAEMRKLQTYESMLGNQHKANTYMFAADMLEFIVDIPSSLEKGEISAIKGIGPSTVNKIKQLVNEGKIDKLEAYKKRVPVSVLSLTDIKGLGPKTAYKMYDELGVKNIDDLKSALDKGDLLTLSRMSTSLLSNIKDYLKDI
jgi:DNA polymerase (family 10)